MEVGIEDCLHIEFEYNKSKYVLFIVVYQLRVILYKYSSTIIIIINISCTVYMFMYMKFRVY